ncbi:MAG: DUF3788 domain-containing protein [Bacteroidales bacterium]|nr:DUF3788 domain-containing protein [Bacteroidales bacterium]
MDKSIFTDKKNIPCDGDLIDPLGNTFELWQLIIKFVHSKYPEAKDEWNYPGEKYGWNFRIKDKKRAIIYLLPREKYFKVAFVFGQKATDTIMRSPISGEIKIDLEAAKVYAEGRGIRIAVNNESVVEDIKTLIEIKLAY